MKTSYKGPKISVVKQYKKDSIQCVCFVSHFTFSAKTAAAYDAADADEDDVRVYTRSMDVQFFILCKLGLFSAM